MSDADVRVLREALVAAARRLDTLGLNRGTAGNVSVRCALPGRDGYLITPSGMPPAEIHASDIVAMPIGGEAPLDPSARRPSSEWRFHRDVYRARPDAGAIVHTHSPFATTLACLGRGIPPFHYMVARAGGRDIRCAAYATFGSQALSDAAVAAIEGRRACLLARHGMIALGRDLADALALAVEVEGLAEVYWRALAVGEPGCLPDDEMDRVAAQFRAYGQPRAGG